MKNTVILLIMLFLSTSINAQTVDPWTKYMTPNEVHTLLGEYVGEFNMEISMWMTEGNAPEIVTISSTHKMILGNRFLEMTQTGNMMGMDYASVSTMGYNTIDHHMSITSLTNMGTGTSHLTGAWDSKTKTALLIGQTTNPMDTKPIQVRQKITFIDKDNLLIENFDTYQGQKEKKSIQYKLVRKPN
jgi:N6-adenosine-specific RNA methylase IME4